MCIRIPATTGAAGVEFPLAPIPLAEPVSSTGENSGVLRRPIDVTPPL